VWAKKNKKVTPVKKPAAPAAKTVPFGKGTRVVKAKPTRFYPADDTPYPLRSNKHNHHNTRLRKSITPGTIVILLAGRFRGRRVVFLKQLTSGLLLVTGPFGVNGVPLRRVNQAYVIATSQKVDVAGVNVSKVDDKFFAKPKEKKHKKSATAFLGKKEKKAGEKTEKKKKTVDAQRKADQEAVDKPLIAAINKVPLLQKYLGVKFTLRNNQHPHDLKF